MSSFAVEQIRNYRRAVDVSRQPLRKIGEARVRFFGMSRRGAALVPYVGEVGF